MKDIARIIKKYDSELEYISGYENCYSIVKCKCNRCGNTFERKWTNLARHNTEYCCPICQTKLGLLKSKENANPHIILVSEREQQFIETLSITKPTYTYVSGYINAKSKVLVKCNECGNEMKYTVDRLTRKNKNIVCKNCVALELNKQKEQDTKVSNMLKQQDKYIKEIKRNKIKEIKKIYKELKLNTLYIMKCKKCGEEILSHNKKSICDRCARKYKIRNHSNKSLKKLYQRDNGICYICGKECNYNDYIYKDNTFIAGNYYPSIDHVIPLAKGGTDEWNNLKLAHRICNSIKG